MVAGQEAKRWGRTESDGHGPRGKGLRKIAGAANEGEDGRAIRHHGRYLH